MTSAQQEIIRATWSLLEPASAKFPDVLYEELFSAHPQLRILFEGPMDEQHRKLTAAMASAVERMNDPVAMDRYFHDLGQRHTAYGVRPHHYGAFKTAFFATLERVLGNEHRPEVREAWEVLLDQLIKAMQSESYGV